MRRLACQLALVASFTATGSSALAASGRHGKTAAKGKPHAKAAPAPVASDSDSDGDDDDAEVPAPPKHKVRAPAARAHAKTKPPARHAEVVADAADDDAADVDDPVAPVAVRAPVHARAVEEDDDTDADGADLEVVAPRPVPLAGQDWNVAFGPYAWASAVDASVSVGGKTVDPSGIKFAKLDHNIKYGGELAGEARYGRLAITGDVIFGAIGIDAGTSAGPLMVNVHGDVSALLADGAAGVRLLGDDHSLLSLEARGGMRYQRVAVRASVGVDGANVAPPELVFAGADALVGGRVFLRPAHRYYFTGTADVGVFGASQRTWSVSADASLRITSHALFSLGWRTLAMDRSSVNLVMQGPRAVLQLLF